MNQIIVELNIVTNKNIYNRPKKSFFYELFNSNSRKLIPLIYKYYITFKIDEGRFYYIEEKPKLNSNNEIIETEKKEIHTKNGCKKSFTILTDIADRVKIIHPEYTIRFYNRYNKDDVDGLIRFFSMFDKEKNFYNETVLLKF